MPLIGVPLLLLCFIEIERRVRLAVIRQGKTIIMCGKRTEFVGCSAALERAAERKLIGGRDYSLSLFFSPSCHGGVFLDSFSGRGHVEGYFVSPNLEEVAVVEF